MMEPNCVEQILSNPIWEIQQLPTREGALGATSQPFRFFCDLESWQTPLQSQDYMYIKQIKIKNPHNPKLRLH